MPRRKKARASEEAPRPARRNRKACRQSFGLSDNVERVLREADIERTINSDARCLTINLSGVSLAENARPRAVPRPRSDFSNRTVHELWPARILPPKIS